MKPVPEKHSTPWPPETQNIETYTIILVSTSKCTYRASGLAGVGIGLWAISFYT